jgi:hypothetical protein
MTEETQDIVSPDAAEQDSEQAKPAAAPETATTEGEQEPQEQEPKPKGGFQRKIDKLTTRLYQRDMELAELRGRLAVQPAAATTKSEPEDLKPDVNTFKGAYEEFVAATARWEARQQYKELSAKERETAAKSEREERDREVVENYRERMEEFTQEHEDFQEVVNRAKLAKDIAGPVQIAILEDDHGPELAYYLGEHAEVCQHLSEMTAAGAVKYLGRLSERLFPEVPDQEEEEEDEEIPLVTPAKPKAAIQAPAPIKPVRKASPTATGLSDDLPIEEWVRRREAQLRKK